MIDNNGDEIALLKEIFLTPSQQFRTPKTTDNHALCGDGHSIQQESLAPCTGVCGSGTCQVG
jgi:hypothetical protein